MSGECAWGLRLSTELLLYMDGVNVNVAWNKKDFQVVAGPTSSLLVTPAEAELQ